MKNFAEIVKQFLFIAAYTELNVLDALHDLIHIRLRRTMYSWLMNNVVTRQIMLNYNRLTLCTVLFEWKKEIKRLKS